MARSVMRRAVSKVLVGAMAVAALGVGQVALGGGVASATPVSQTVTTDNIRAVKTIDNPTPFPGDTVKTTVVLNTTGGVDRYLKDFTDLPPAGFVLQSVDANVWRSGPLGGDWNDPSRYDGTVTQNPVTGGVTMKWTDHGVCAGIACDLVLINKTATLTFIYKVAADAQPGPRTTGMEFNPYTWGSVARWNPLNQLNVSVQQPMTATTASVTVPPIAKTGTPVQLAANVLPANATGTFQFKDGTTNIGSPVPVSNGVATLTHTFTTADTHVISAAFSGSAGFTNSNAPGRPVVVSEPGADDKDSSTIMTAPSTATVGTAVRLSAQVSSDALSLPGTVQFYDGGTPIGPRLPVGNGVVFFEHTFTAAGAHEISAAYTGGAGVSGSASLPQTVQVADAPTPPGPAGSLGSLGSGSAMFGS